MKKFWFKKWGWLYRPVSFMGWLSCFITLVLMVKVFVVVDANSHSVSDTLIGVFPWTWIFLATLLWVASKTSD